MNRFLLLIVGAALGVMSLASCANPVSPSTGTGTVVVSVPENVILSALTMNGVSESDNGSTDFPPGSTTDITEPAGNVTATYTLTTINPTYGAGNAVIDLVVTAGEETTLSLPTTTDTTSGTLDIAVPSDSTITNLSLTVGGTAYPSTQSYVASSNVNMALDVGTYTLAYDWSSTNSSYPASATESTTITISSGTTTTAPLP